MPGYMEVDGGCQGKMNGRLKRLFVKCFVQVIRIATYLPGDPRTVPPTNGVYSPMDVNAAAVAIPPHTIGMMAITAEMDSVQTAAAIYRGNDLQQSYDES